MNIEAPSIARRGCVGLLLMAVSACSTPRSSAEAQQSEQRLAEARAALVQELRLQGIESDEVLDALGRVPRERFVPPAYVGDAYANHPLPIGHGQTISQPFVVALMSEVLDLEAGDRVLEIGTGSGY